jgi:hypothetical protein
MNHNIFLGAIEQVVKTGKPGARLRPFLQASPDKKSWVAIEEEFPNAGVVSWWELTVEADEQKIWTFEIEHSWSFDPSNIRHDAFMVKGTPSPALELVLLPEIEDPEDARTLLVETGIPLEQCASRRVYVRLRSGQTLGPLEFTNRDGRLYVDEQDPFLPLYQWRDDLGCGEWNGHHILPIRSSLPKIGEVDFSSNVVFLKRVLNDIKEMPSEIFEAANLTKKLIGQYSSALEKVSLTPLKAQRLRRLHKMSERAALGIDLGETAVSDLLWLPPVKALISSAKDDAVRSAIEERQAELTGLDGKRQALGRELEELRLEAGRLRDAIAASTKEQNGLLTGFDSRVQDKFEEIEKNATAFLAEVAILRAALSMNERTTARPTSATAHGIPPNVPRLSPDRIVQTVRQKFEAGGLGCIHPSLLLSSWASGYMPMIFGVLTRDILQAASESLFGGAMHLATLGPTMTSPTDLVGVPAASRFGVSSIGEVADTVGHSDDVALLVLDGVNLAQLDSLVLPLLRPYAEFHSQGPGEVAELYYSTPLGMWPRNLLLAGVLVDSPLALPMSREIWTYASFVDASGRHLCPSAKTHESRPEEGLLRLPYETWKGWLRTARADDSAGTDLIAAYLTRKVESSFLFKRMSRHLADAIDHTALGLSEEKRAQLFVETLLPYVLSRDVVPESILDGAPASVSTEDGFLDAVTALFEKWGLEVR